MNRGYPSTLRRGQRARLRRRLTAGVLASFAACALAAVWPPPREQVRAAPVQRAASLPAAAAPVQSARRRPAAIDHPVAVVPGGVASQAEPAREQEPSTGLLGASFEEGLEAQDGAIASVSGPGLAAPTKTANARSSGPAVATAGASAPVLPPQIGDLRTRGYLSTGRTAQLETGGGGGAAVDPARGSAPPMLVVVDTSAQPGEAPAADPGPFLPQADPTKPLPPDSSLVDASWPAEVPEPASSWLFAGALTALLTLRRKD